MYVYSDAAANTMRTRFFEVSKYIWRYEQRHMCTTRDLHIWKETYIYEKWRIYTKRDLFIWKETYVNIKDLCIWKETFTYEKKPTHMKRDVYIWKETCTCEKRPKCDLKDLYMWKESFAYEYIPVCMKTDPYIQYTKPIHIIYEKRPIYVNSVYMDISLWILMHFFFFLHVSFHISKSIAVGFRFIGLFVYLCTSFNVYGSLLTWLTYLTDATILVSSSLPLWDTISLR